MKKIVMSFILSFTVGLSLAQIIDSKELKKYNGFFNFYYEESEDKIYLEVKNLDEEFLYVNSLTTGIGSNDIGLDRGQLGNEHVVKFIKTGNKLLLVQPNQNYRAITNNNLEKKSVEQAFARSILFGFPILEKLNGNYIIDFSPFLLQDTHGVINTLKQKKQGDYKIDLSKSALWLENTRAFPKNVEFEALLTFRGDPKGKNIKSVVPTPSLVSAIQHHSFIELPDNNYSKREFDPRSGAISISYLDYSTPIQEPIVKKYIIRHRLEKKNPNKKISEAVKPIIYYLDPGTPEPVRSALIDGAKWWNEAFSEIGYKDAFQVKILPDNVDPMDCRYNVIQWVHRSTRGWSYGGSIIDPRTGEIIKGHVSLGSLRIRQDFLIAQALLNKPFKERDDNYKPMLDMALARIRQLSAHEVGHTLGFAHNFAASTNNRASVMDYPHPIIKITNNEIDFSDAYAVGIGNWDKVTVAYSYSEFKKKLIERDALNSILKKAQKDGLRFISDSDARPLGGAHALAHLWDNGESITNELENILKVRKKAISNFSADNIRENEPYSVLEDMFVPLYFLHRYQLEAVSKLVGGLDYNYAVKGDDQLITKTIEKPKQTKALQLLIKTLDVNNLAIPEEKLKLFPPRAFGFSRTRESFKGKTGVGFDALSVASTASDMTLKLLLHPERSNRLVQQKSLNKEQLGLNEVLNELINNSFKKKHNNFYLNEVQQLININVLKHIMNLAVTKQVYFQVNAIAFEALNNIEKNLGENSYSNQYKYLIKKFHENPDKFEMNNSPKIPDGSPIGSDFCNYLKK